MDAPVTALSESPEDPFAARNAASLVLDDHGTVVAWSAAAGRLLGYDGEDIIGRSAVDVLIAPADRPMVLRIAEDCLRTGGWFGILPVRHRGGHPVGLGLRVRTVTRRQDVREWLLVCAPADAVIEWQRDRAILDGLFRRSPIGLVVHSPDLRVLRVNRAIERVTHMSDAEHRGLRSGEALVGEDWQAAEDRVRRVLETGKPQIHTEQSARLRGAPGRELVVSVSSFGLEDPAGRVLGVAETIEDITDRYRAQRRLALLNEASERIGTTLDVARTARELADVAVPDLADCAAVDLLEPVAPGEAVARGAPRRVRRMAVGVASDQACAMTDPVGAVFRPAPGTPQARCLAERRPVLEPVLGPATEAPALAPRCAGRAADRGVHSLIVAPLIARGEVLGLVSLWRSRRPEPFEDDDLRLAQEFAARAAVSIDNARRYTEQQQAALTLQRSLLPPDALPHPAVDVAHRYLPAGGTVGVGGDWFDVIPLSGARVALVVGDVAGHGLHAAATMGRLRAAVHTLASLDLEPDEVLARLDDLVELLAAEQEAGSRPPPDEQVVGATCLYAVYDPVSRHCTMARAGHPPPVLADPGGEVSLPDVPAGPPLGLGGLPFEECDLELAEGSVLAFYTNGLLQGGGEDVDTALEGLCAALAGPGEPLSQTCQAIIDLLQPGVPSDDVALLLARTGVLPPEHVASWHLPGDPSAPARARALTAATLSEWGLEHLTFTTELIASELVTNAYRYSNGPMVLRLIRNERLSCEVADSSSTSPHLRRARSTDEGGRGLFLVAQVSERWGTRYTHDGKTVWTEQAIGRP